MKTPLPWGWSETVQNAIPLPNALRFAWQIFASAPCNTANYPMECLRRASNLPWHKASLRNLRMKETRKQAADHGDFPGSAANRILLANSLTKRETKPLTINHQP